MTNTKSTKRALLTSVMALLLCFTMLLGTTYAWFTDTVTSGTNKIVAGNLDIALTHTNQTVTDEDVQDSTDLFSGVTLWEPGAVAWENLTVKNVGNLALKYTLSINFTDVNTIEDRGLSEILKVAVVEEIAKDATREEVLEAAKSGEALANFSLTGKIEADADDVTYGIVIYWEPSDNDNLYNVNNGKTTSDGKALQIELGINLFATQDTVETDSIDNMYDELANATMVKTAGELVAAIANGGEIALAEDITINGNRLSITSDTVIYGLGNTLTYSGNDTYVLDVATQTGADLTVKDLTIEINNSYCQRGINYNVPNGNLTLNNVTLTGATKATYGINLPGSSDGAKVEIVDSDITALIALNVWGENSVINVTDSNLSNYDTSDVENYTTIKLNNDGTTAAEGTVINITGGSITARDQNGDPANIVGNGTKQGVVNISNTTAYVGEIETPVAAVRYVDDNGNYYSDYYSMSSLQAAVNKAAENSNAVVVLTNDISVDSTVEIPEGKTVIIDLNGYTISAETTAIRNNGTLTISGDGVIDVSSATENTLQVIDNHGVLTLNGGTYKGARTMYSYALRNYGTMYVNQATVDGGFGGVAIQAGASAVITDGTFSNSMDEGAHVFLAYANTNVTINGGNFLGHQQDTGNFQYTVIATDGANVTINGGNFVAQTQASGNKLMLSGKVTVSGGTFDVNPGNYVADGYVATESNGVWTVAAE